MKFPRKKLIIIAIVSAITLITINISLTKGKKIDIKELATKIESSEMGYKIDETLGAKRGGKQDILSSIRLKNTEKIGFANNMLIDEYENSKLAKKNFDKEFEESKKLSIKHYQIRKGNLIISSYCVGGVGHAPTKSICPNYDKEIRILEDIIGKPDQIKEFDDDKEHYHEDKAKLDITSNSKINSIPKDAQIFIERY